MTHYNSGRLYRKSAERPMCSCGRQKIAVLDGTKCSKCTYEEKRGARAVAPMCGCGKHRVKKKNETLCWFCRNPLKGRDKYQRNVRVLQMSKPENKQPIIVPQSLTHMSPEHIIKHWNKVQI